MKNVKKNKNATKTINTPLATMITINEHQIESQMWNLETLRCALEYAITRAIQCGEEAMSKRLLNEKRIVDKKYLNLKNKQNKFNNLVDKEFYRCDDELKASDRKSVRQNVK